VDWLNVTLPWGGTVLGLLDAMRLWFSIPVWGVERKGVHGFTEGLTVFGYAGGRALELGVIAHGGEAQQGRWLVSLSGTGCGVVDSWWVVRTWLEEQDDVRITRLDLACDLHEGEYTVDDAVRWHGDGGFNVGGRNPRTRTDGDWLEGRHGRTLYVGKRENGKMLRVYEKGKEQGWLDSEWVRFEVQFGNRDRVIPFEALTERDKYFAGAYPALEQLLAVAGERIRTVRDDAVSTIERMKEGVKRTYGKFLGFLADNGVSPADLVDEVRITGLPVG
jgi:phage replication initiation protein